MSGGCGRQNNPSPKDVHVLIPRTCDYVRFLEPLEGMRAGSHLDFSPARHVLDF